MAIVFHVTQPRQVLFLKVMEFDEEVLVFDLQSDGKESKNFEQDIFVYRLNEPRHFRPEWLKGHWLWMCRGIAVYIELLNLVDSISDGLPHSPWLEAKVISFFPNWSSKFDLLSLISSS